MKLTKQYLFAGFISIAASVVPLGVYSQEALEKVRVNRYTLADIEPTPSQLDLMSVIVDIEFSSSVETVGEAIQELLSSHGFKLGEISAGNYSQYVLYLLPLPETHRQLGPLRLEAVLQVLGGEGFKLVINPITREVSYHIKETYDDMLSTNEVIRAKKRWDAEFGVLQSRNILDKSCDEKSLIKKATYGPVEAGNYLSKIAFAIMPQVYVSIFES